MGVYGWKGQENFWRSVPLKDRKVYIVFDSDISDNPNVRRAAASLFAFLESLGAEVSIVRLPAVDGHKVGLDDYLAAGNTANSLLALATGDPPTFSLDDDHAVVNKPNYEATDEGIFRVNQSKDGPVKRQLTNFSAQILAETLFVNGEEFLRELDIEAVVKGQEHSVTVSSFEFENMSWVINRLGADAIVMAGAVTKDEVRAAIQLLSPDIKKCHGIQRLGWTRDNGEDVYVHAAGVIRPNADVGANFDHANRPRENSSAGNDLAKTGPNAPISDHKVSTPELKVRAPAALQRYALPRPSAGDQLIRDIRTSLAFLSLAPFRLSVPIYCSIWYAALAEADFSLHLYGGTGNFKTEFTALAAQHFGPGLNARHLPANWSSTPNYIRAVSAYAQNVILPVDDFVPTGSQTDIDRSFRNAEDVFRAQGNAGGKGRCNRDGTPRVPEPPKCLVLSTGEVRPSGHSLNARVLTLEVFPGEIFDRNDKTKKELFTRAQSDAASGAYAKTMSSFLHWVVNQLDTQKKDLADQARNFREVFAPECRHARTADIAAKLLAGLDSFLDFALRNRAIDEGMFDDIWQAAHHALFTVLEDQDRESADEDPVLRFLDLLQTALAIGRAHLSYLTPPCEEEARFGSPKYFGHEEKTIRRPVDEGDTSDSADKEYEKNEERTVFVPQGERVGWKNYDDLFLEPKASLAVVQRLARELNQPPIPLNHKALGKRLKERGLLESSRNDRNVTRRNIDGRKVDVFHLRLNDFIELTRIDGDFVDLQNEVHYQERENALRRQERIDSNREARRREVREFTQRQFVDLLNP